MKKVAIEELQFGMYVNELDCPWTDTPFVFQGFFLTTPEQLEVLRRFCKHVYVDPERVAEPERERVAAVPLAPAAPKLAGTGRVHYQTSVSVESELAQARDIYKTSEESVYTLIEDFRETATLDATVAASAARSMSDSIKRNPDALVLFSTLKEREDLIDKALHVSVYMVALARFLEMSEADLEMAGLVGLLLDVGKLRIPNEVLAKRERLTPEELVLVRSHVNHSVDILEATPGISPEVVQAVAMHHERYDGSGYPKGLRGEELGVIASIAGIVDTFVGLTSKRPYASPVAPSNALNMLHKWRGTVFHPTLVEQFIRCIGIFPVGAVVELNSGEIAVVIAQNQEKRLQPRIMVVRDAAGNPLRPQKLLDLSKAPKVNAEEPYRIRRTLEFGKASVSRADLFL
ncbi:MAG TPA: HD domain-containing phosphohydrolase [Steroidobacteraceae bacterium]|nr:HD domain-containing phosphohydrolase [Steroidobacteraceae bacterium]